MRLGGFINPVLEILPLDIHMLTWWVKIPEVVNRNCDPAVPNACENKERSYNQGLSFMITADANSLISELVKKLAP